MSLNAPTIEKVILVVDDELVIREALGTLFEMSGIRSFLAQNGKEALEILNREHIDLVLSDVRMPEIDGIELLKKIKMTLPLLPVFLMTGYSDCGRNDALALGAADLVRKPFDLDSLLLRLHPYLASSSA